MALLPVSAAVLEAGANGPIFFQYMNAKAPARMSSAHAYTGSGPSFLVKVPFSLSMSPPHPRPIGPEGNSSPA